MLRRRRRRILGPKIFATDGALNLLVVMGLLSRTIDIFEKKRKLITPIHTLSHGLDPTHTRKMFKICISVQWLGSSSVTIVGQLFSYNGWAGPQPQWLGNHSDTMVGKFLRCNVGQLLSYNGWVAPQLRWLGAPQLQWLAISSATIVG